MAGKWASGSQLGAYILHLPLAEMQGQLVGSGGKCPLAKSTGVTVMRPGFEFTNYKERGEAVNPKTGILFLILFLPDLGSWLSHFTIFSISLLIYDKNS